MVGEREQHVALDRAVAAAGLVGGHDQAADRAAGLVHGRRHRRPRCRARASAARHPRPPGTPPRRRAGPRPSRARRCRPRAACAHRAARARRGRAWPRAPALRVVGRHELQAGHLVAEQLAGTEADRVEHVLAHGAVGDRALDAGEPLEQVLALLERVEQALVQLGLGLRLVPLAALLGGEPEQAQRQASTWAMPRAR